MGTIITFIIANWKVISLAVAAVGAWYKDSIMAKIGIRKGKGEADSVHIQNSEQLMDLYRKSVADLNAVKEEHVNTMKTNHKEEIEDIRNEHAKNLQEIKDEHLKILQTKEEEAKIEKDSLKSTVDKLEKQVTRLTLMVDKLGKQIAFYREHSDLELPDDLQD